MYQPLAPEEVATTEMAGNGAALSRPKPIPIVPVPPDAPPMKYRHREHGEPSRVWRYHDATGTTVGYVCRWDFTDEAGELDKLILPVAFCDLGDGRTGWAAKGFPAPRPLYRLPQILARPDARLLVVEGEKAAEAAAKLFPEFVATTPPHGAHSPRKADWTPLEGRQVIVWPDNDEAGAKYAEAVARLCTDSGVASVAIADVPSEFPAKWDLADELPEGWTRERLRDLLDNARPYEPPGEMAFGRPQTSATEHSTRSAETALPKSSGDETQRDILACLAGETDLFHVPDGTGFADIPVNGHRETWPVRSKGFRRWLTRRFFEATSGAPNAQAMQDALGLIEARAHFDAPEREVSVRIAVHAGRLYLDLADSAWRAVEVGPEGWRIVDAPPVRFRRASGMLPLPEPKRGGTVEALRPFLNVRSDGDFVLAVAWLLAALRERGPYPVLVLAGEQGAAKSTFSGLLRALVDPNTSPLRALPREDRDLFIAATNGYVLAFDNVSRLQPWISDTLCRLATGGGFAVRQLYTDQDEVLFDATRPVILNGIEDMVTRPDLADRGIFLTLDPIPEGHRRPERALLAEFERERPRILGALLDVVAHGLKRLPSTSLDRLPRMADFALWATACEGMLWDAGTFMNAYDVNREDAVAGVVDADPVGSAVRVLMTEQTEWAGTASDLLSALSNVTEEAVYRTKTWPATPRALSGRLRRSATFLRQLGVQVQFEREGRSRTRMIHITRAENSGSEPSAPSAPSAQADSALNSPDMSADGMRTQTSFADGAREASVREKPLKNTAADGADGVDARIPPESAPDEDWEVEL
jgi:hypothetical protein